VVDRLEIIEPQQIGKFASILMTALLVWSFVSTFLNVVRDLVPPLTLCSSFIYVFGCFSVAVFFYAFHRAQ
jgi:hypothetical protein